MISFLLLLTTERVVKPLPGPNWPDQPVLTVYGPQTWPLESVWLAGLPVTLNEQDVAGAVCMSMANDQVQEPDAQTRFMFSIVHSGTAAIMETAPS